jgi:hypothetical protein
MEMPVFPLAGRAKVTEKIPYMTRKNVVCVFYIIENANLSSMSKVIIFCVLYAISVSLTV